MSWTLPVVGFGLLGAVGLAVTVATLRRAGGALAAHGPPGYVDEDEELFRFQLAHGIVSCPPDCLDPEHARLRSLRERPRPHPRPHPL